MKAKDTDELRLKPLALIRLGLSLLQIITRNVESVHDNIPARKDSISIFSRPQRLWLRKNVSKLNSRLDVGGPSSFGRDEKRSTMSQTTFIDDLQNDCKVHHISLHKCLHIMPT